MNGNYCNSNSSDGNINLVSSKKSTSQVIISHSEENDIINSEELLIHISADIVHYEYF